MYSTGKSELEFERKWRVFELRKRPIAEKCQRTRGVTLKLE